ncbi:hypothetical protein AAFC00_003685 [Neodothiora populina]|uniref:FAD-binding PCMH-type domain-containing protein n=1 Tax=Neodothiora populina TaxID=2781224 RepID=A0ABR3PF23_9PEZI
MVLELWSPPPTKLNTNFILGEIVYNINAMSELHPNIDTDMLRALADALRNDRVEAEDALRAFCQIFRDTYSFDYASEQLDPKTQSQVIAFVEGKPAAEIAAHGLETASSFAGHHVFDHHKLAHMGHKGVHSHESAAHKLVDKAKAKLTNSPIVYEDEQESMIMEVYADVPFTNWALNIRMRPIYTFVPTTVLGLQNLVRAYKGQRIRCSGYRHSRAPVFTDDGDILVSLLPLRQVTSLPDPSALIPDAHKPSPSELRTVQLLPSGKDIDRLHVRVGSAVTVEELRQCAVKDEWALPTDISMGEITIGGLNGSISHGSGYSHKTINDEVIDIEYVDVNGVLQVVTDDLELCAAAGCFGLLGIVTHITYEVRRTTYAVMKPRKMPTMLAIPPLDLSEVPEALQLLTTKEQVHEAVLDFEVRAETSEHAEWTWYPYQSSVLVNTWTSGLGREGAVDYIDNVQGFLQWISGWIGGVISSTDFYADIPAR